MAARGKVYAIAAVFSAAMALSGSHGYGAATAHGRPDSQISQALGKDGSGNATIDDIIWDDGQPPTGTKLP